MLPPDTPPSAPLTIGEQTEMLIDGDDKVSPATFPVPTPSPDYIETLASDLRSAGESVGDTGNDITSAWSGLRSHYKAPEAEHLYSVLEPVAADGDTVSTDLGHAASALETFAADLRDIKSRWSGLRAEAFEFRARIDAKGEDWRKAEGVAGFFGIGEHPDVAENKRLIEDGTRIIEDYADAELACANAINRFVPDRTPFEKTPSGDGALDPDVFYHGYDEDLSDLATEWGVSGAAVDESWLVDGWDAVWDFGVGAVEGTGAMLGMHSSEGWFNMSWGDALYEYHESNIQSVASLVGMYDAESDSYGWSGWDTVGSAWKDLAHSVVPWEEWGERPGYVIGTAVLNIGVTALGAALSATGVGAAVGVPLMAWRGMAIVDGMGGRGGDSGSGSSTDVDVDLPAGVPTFGGSGAPVVRIDTSVFNPDGLSPQQLGDLRGSLDRLQRITNDPADGSHADGSPPPQSAPVQGDSDPSESRRTTARPIADRETEANERPSRAEPETDRAGADDEQALLEEASGEERGSSPVPVIEDTSDTSHRPSPTESGSQDPTAEQLSESDRLLRQVNGMFTAEDHANFQVNQRAETALYEGDRATVDPDSSPLKDSQVAERYGLDGRANAAFSDMRAVASDYPHVNWEGGPGDGRDGHGGRDEPEADREYATTAPRPDADTASAQKPIPHGQVQHVNLGDSSGHRVDASRIGAPDARSGSDAGFRHDRGADVETRRPVAVNRADSVPGGDGGSDVDTPPRGEVSNNTNRTEEQHSTPNHGDRDRMEERQKSTPTATTDRRENTRSDTDLSGSHEDSAASSQTPRRPGENLLEADVETHMSHHRGTSGQGEGLTGRLADEFIIKKLSLKPDMDWMDFAGKFIGLLNKSPDGLFSEYYQKNGHRHSIERQILGMTIPMITRAKEGLPWIVKESLPSPRKPDYRFPGKRVTIPRDSSHHAIGKIDFLAKERFDAVESNRKSREDVEKQKKAYPNNAGPENDHPKVVAAQERQSLDRAAVSVSSEMYGETTAAAAVPKLFDGNTKVTVFFENKETGEKETKEIKLPEVIDDKPLPKFDTAPDSGNYQFDQIWPAKDGKFVIVEAKGDKDTSLGERTVGDGKNTKRISQGTHAYLKATFSNMKERGLEDKTNGKKPNEWDMAEKLEKALAERKLYYTEVKAMTDNSGRHSGLTFGLYDLSNKN
ncbi:hypothetical protein [Nocardiopsis alborubida]|uniref:Uncharacterized protein n=1 Tax=Nocardiopsis alborubida TaxID=146802 RepID=A0A7X6RSE2_9ACTN|nr:hypothetical protein [Nocardiopsis alborubida]NKZ00238.1 hypothetical protein [Nocardiopsis alborubida]